VDGADYFDVQMGTYRSYIRVLLNTGDGTFRTSIQLPGAGA
jgi:hypothetical protein